jgi:hypothetical protein
VNNDGYVSPLDALLVINALNQPPADLTSSVLDVNGDRHLSPLDALLVINKLNSPAPDAFGSVRQAAAACFEVPEADNRRDGSVAPELGRLDQTPDRSKALSSSTLIRDEDLEDAICSIAEAVATERDGKARSLDDVFGEFGKESRDI